MRGVRITIAAIVAVGLMALAGPAFAGDSSPGSPPKGTIVFRDGGTDGGTDSGATEVGGAASLLPFTGAQITGFVVVALLTIGAGMVIVRRTRDVRRLT